MIIWTLPDLRRWSEKSQKIKENMHINLHPVQLDQDCSAICIFLGKFAALLSNFKFKTIIWPWKSLKPENDIKDSKTVFRYEIYTKIVTCEIFKDSMVKSTFINLACKHFLWSNEKYLQRRDDLSLKSFTGQKSGLISHLKTVLESWKSGHKIYHFVFLVHLSYWSDYRLILK